VFTRTGGARGRPAPRPTRAPRAPPAPQLPQPRRRRSSRVLPASSRARTRPWPAAPARASFLRIGPGAQPHTKLAVPGHPLISPPGPSSTSCPSPRSESPSTPICCVVGRSVAWEFLAEVLIGVDGCGRNGGLGSQERSGELRQQGGTPGCEARRPAARRPGGAAGCGRHVETGRRACCGGRRPSR
jgi:hypothetical protein